MQKFISILIIILFAGCNSTPNSKKVIINKTVKIFSKEYHDQAENYTFKWNPPIGPNKQRMAFDLKNDMLIFTPNEIGTYEVDLTIEDISEKIVAMQTFYFSAIPETLEVAFIEEIKDTINIDHRLYNYENKSNLGKKTKSKVVQKSKVIKPNTTIKNTPSKKSKNVKYAIQISSWPSLEEARSRQLDLIDNGFDAYTQKYYWKEKDEVWFRVRVGNFINKNNALEIKKQIEILTGLLTWLDVATLN